MNAYRKNAKPPEECRRIHLDAIPKAVRHHIGVAAEFASFLWLPVCVLASALAFVFYIGYSGEVASVDRCAVFCTANGSYLLRAGAGDPCVCIDGAGAVTCVDGKTFTPCEANP